MTADATLEPIAVGARLPEITLPSTPDGRAVRVVRQGRLATILLLLHGADCTACMDYLESLLGRIDDLRDWDGRLLPVIRDDAAAAAERSGPLPESYPLLVDAAGTTSARLGLAEPAVVIADQWGEVFLVHRSGSAHDFPAADEIVEWARFLAIQCPECQGEAK